MRSHIQAFVFVMLLGFSAAFARTELERQGLLNYKVTCVVKDRKGMMWVGTLGGLQTFDGYRFSQVCYLRNYEITSLAEDLSRNCLWIGTSSGLFYYDFLKGTLELYHPIVLFYHNNEDRFSCIPYYQLKYIDHILVGNGNVYVNFNKEAYILRIRPDGGNSLVPGTNRSNDSLNRTSIAFFAGGNKLFYTSGKKVIEFDENTGKSVMHELDMGRYRSFTRIGDRQILYVNNDGRIQAYDYKKRKEIPHPLNGRMARRIAGNKGDVFFENDGQLYLFYEGDTTVKRLYSDSVPGNFIGLYVDENNTGWLGTRKGLVRVVEKKSPAMQHFLRSVSTRQIVSDSAYLYVSGYNGLIRYAKDRRQKKKDSLISTNYCRSLLYDTANGYLYIGGEAPSPNNFYRYNLRTGAVEKDFYKGPLMTRYVLSMVKDRNNTIWIGTAEGLYSMQGREIKYHRDAGTDNIRYLQLYRKNLLLASGTNKVNVIDTKTGNIKKVMLPDIEGVNEVFYAAEGMDGNIWVGTNSEGIYVLSPGLSVTRHITSSDGLPNDCINGMIWENAHKVWIATNSGICLYNLGTGKFITYHPEDGIADEEFNQNSFLKDKDGRFYFGGIDGITTFYPDQAVLEQKPFNVFASNIEKWGESKRHTLNGSLDQLVLDPGDYSLTFSFGINDYSMPEKNMFYYRITGIHEEWRLMRENNTMVIDHLPSGSYTMEVKAVNEHGMISSNRLRYEIISRPVFYETGWFSMLIILLVSGGMYLYFKWRLSMIKKLQDVRTQIASHLHDEVGGTLTSIAMMSEQLSGTRKPVDETKLKRIAQLSREATLSMSDVLWSIDGRNDSTRNLADRMKEQAEDMLLSKGIRLFFDFSSQQENHSLRPEARQHFFLIFKEALNNILKHSNASYVKIHYAYRKGNFMLQIENDGAEHFNKDRSGQGLKNIEMRARMLGASATFTHHQGVVTITVKQI